MADVILAMRLSMRPSEVGAAMFEEQLGFRSVEYEACKWRPPAPPRAVDAEVDRFFVQVEGKDGASNFSELTKLPLYRNVWDFTMTTSELKILSV